MKKNIIVVLSCFFVFSNCSIKSEDSTPSQEFQYFWHLINVSGGVAGIDEPFGVDTVVWTFDDATNTLTVENNNTDDTIEDGLDSGTYGYSVLDIDGTTYLIVDDNEIGSYSVSSTTLTIDQNKKSTGNVSDGFIYIFQIEVVAI